MHKYRTESGTDEIWVPVNGTYKIKVDKQLTAQAPAEVETPKTPDQPVA